MTATMQVPSTAVDPAGDRRRLRGLALLASIVVSFLAASAAPAPLYQHYALAWHGTALTTTEVFGVYAGSVLVGLLALGELSNHVGRRPVLLAALAGQAVAVLLFATASSFEPFFIGRVVQGVAAGAALGTLGAAMIDLHRRHGTLASAAAPGAGTGLGSLVAGLVVGYLPWPTHLIYLVLIGVFALQAVGVLRVLDANETRPGVLASLRPAMTVPRAARRAFLAAAPALFAFWALAGLYGSLGPALARGLAASTSIALGGLTLFVMAGFAFVTTIAYRNQPARPQLLQGIAALVLGVAATIVAIEAGSIWGFFAATAVAGCGFGMGLQGSIRSVVSLVEPHERAGLLSAVYLVSYAGMGAPAVVAGYLVSRGQSLTGVAVGYAVALVGLALIALAQLFRPARGQ
ncbi:MFS transporter [Streptomyces sp. NRRL F-5126]|uniref:MFS transporter n=1 Tax=Streptomyces sp. NRRL F-5126 TaxID=1463857 RepID=UPI0004CAB5F1|nr:MFS transporter [Streptomyces sp. NRRL F-5126]